VFKKVLMALDFSGPAMELFSAVPDLRRLGLEELLLVHAVRVELGVGDGISRVQLAFLEKVKGRKEELENEGLSVEIEIPAGAPATEIKKLAEQMEVDLILIGSVGESSKVRELFLGSTVADVLRVAPVPVLVEKYASNKEGVKRLPIFKEKSATLLLPTDFSASADFVYKKILEISDRIEKVVLLHVVDKGDTREKVAENKTEAEVKLKIWAEKFEEKGVSTTVSVTEGQAVKQILDAAEKEKTTLLAISRRGGGSLSGLLIGNIADQVVRRSSCPVLLFGKYEK